MRYSAVVLSLLVSGALGCSGSKKKVDDADSFDMGDAADGDTGKGDEKPDPRPDPEPADPEPSDQPKPKPYSKDDDYEIGYQDCDALAGAYARAWQNDELAKLNERKLKPAAFDKAAAGVKSNAGEMSSNWKDECYQTVGTAYLRSRLKCAMKAKSMEKFNNCMDGVE